jgi:hypothetical protein
VARTQALEDQKIPVINSTARLAPAKDDHVAIASPRALRAVVALSSIRSLRCVIHFTLCEIFAGLDADFDRSTRSAADGEWFIDCLFVALEKQSNTNNPAHGASDLTRKRMEDAAAMSTQKRRCEEFLHQLFLREFMHKTP